MPDVPDADPKAPGFGFQWPDLRLTLGILVVLVALGMVCYWYRFEIGRWFQDRRARQRLRRHKNQDGHSDEALSLDSPVRNSTMRRTRS
jgi:hypothetical protein